MSEKKDQTEDKKIDEHKVVNTHHQSKFKLNKNLLIIILILLALPLTVALVLVQQEIRGRAEGQTIARVEVSPGAVSAMEKGPSVALSALAYDFSGNPINHSSVTYEWSMSSTNSVGTLTKTTGVITEFNPLTYGCGQITVIARSSTQGLSEIKNRLSFVPKANAQTAYVAKSVTVSVGSANGYPNCGTPSPTPFITPTPTPGNIKQQTSLKCDANITLNDYSTKQIIAALVGPSGQVLGSRNISWTLTPGTSNYPLISPSSALTGTNGEAKTNVWMPEGFYGSGRNTIKSEFSGDNNNYPSTCYTTVSYSITNLTKTPTPTPIKLTLNPSADAFVRSSDPNTNFGSSTSLQTDTNPNEIAYLKFNLAPLAGKTITKATLVLKVSAASSAQQNLRLSDDNSWTEGNLKYSNRPTFVSTATSFIPKPVDSKLNLDVRTAVNKKKGGTMTLGIVSQANAKASFYSRESASANRPQLIIEYQ